MTRCWDGIGLPFPHLGWGWGGLSVPWLRRTARVACRRAGAPALPALPHLCAVGHTQALPCHDNESQQLGGSSAPLPALPACPAVRIHRSALGSPGGHRGGVPGSKTSLRPRSICQRTLPQPVGKEAGGARDLQSSPPRRGEPAALRDRPRHHSPSPGPAGNRDGICPPRRKRPGPCGGSLPSPCAGRAPVTARGGCAGPASAPRLEPRVAAAPLGPPGRP